MKLSHGTVFDNGPTLRLGSPVLGRHAASGMCEQFQNGTSPLKKAADDERMPVLPVTCHAKGVDGRHGEEGMGLCSTPR